MSFHKSAGRLHLCEEIRLFLLKCSKPFNRGIECGVFFSMKITILPIKGILRSSYKEPGGVFYMEIFSHCISRGIFLMEGNLGSSSL